ncbi:DUF421 domain-containing protein [Novosphingobium marinum]|uniref:Uncharacterized membrane protein YcaP (DUF421 family) n=1 Tax=Novosphingobium marinum TaxID=1514948 RepID=A0A7Y9Y1C6_9SPHN|nr:YetF domain-containing protein [Novosphingobium marinum]NYH96811.1 uncharacterized membrane protein YcaP (DUF421 family) [Novosphingobium marinum]GGC40060.1 DUF421 domain-containing protein [Novosphingobium marinum]
MTLIESALVGDEIEKYLRVLICAPVIYFTIILFIRISGKRSTSQMNNFDWVVTVALGSLAASGIILKDVPALQVIFAFGLLLLLQFILTKLIYRSEFAANLVKAEPALLVADGKFCRETMRNERVTEAEVNAAIRAAQLTDLSQVRWVILETDATMSVIPREPADTDRSAMREVDGFKRGAIGT